MRELIVLAFNFEVFHMKFSEKYSPSKKSKLNVCQAVDHLQGSHASGGVVEV